MEQNLDALCNEYIDLSQELKKLSKQRNEIKKRTTFLEKEIKQIMTDRQMDSIALPKGEIVRYDRKISQTFKRETIMENLTEKVKDIKKAEELTNSILSNKKFSLENKIRPVLR